MHRRLPLILLVLALLGAGCGGSAPPEPDQTAGELAPDSSVQASDGFDWEAFVARLPFYADASPAQRAAHAEYLASLPTCAEVIGASPEFAPGRCSLPETPPEESLDGMTLLFRDGEPCADGSYLATMLLGSVGEIFVGRTGGGPWEASNLTSLSPEALATVPGYEECKAGALGPGSQQGSTTEPVIRDPADSIEAAFNGIRWDQEPDSVRNGAATRTSGPDRCPAAAEIPDRFWFVEEVAAADGPWVAYRSCRYGSSSGQSILIFVEWYPVRSAAEVEEEWAAATGAALPELGPLTFEDARVGSCAIERPGLRVRVNVPAGIDGDACALAHDVFPVAVDLRDALSLG